MNNENYKPQKSDFEFIQRGQKIYDKKFDTKPLGYFKDAMLRFTKNKTNVVATAILFTIIALAIIVPIASPKNSDDLEEQVSYLPPRIPILENLGIFDGTVNKKDQLVDQTNVDEETGLYMPSGIRSEVIVPGTLKNYTAACSTKKESCEGGQNLFLLDANSDHVSILTATGYYDPESDTLVTQPQSFTFIKNNNPVITLVVDDISNTRTDNYNAQFNLYILPDGGTDEDLIFLGSVSTVGEHNIPVFDNIDQSVITGRVKIEFTSNSDYSQASIDRFAIYTGDTALTDASGFDLSMYRISSTDGSSGNYVRVNGTVLFSSYKYLKYDDKFYYKPATIGAEEFDSIINQYGDDCQQFPDPTGEGLWRYPDTCPIRKVIRQSSPVQLPDGTEAFTYSVILNYMVYKGYDSVPYYIFGTDAFGRDVFKLIWIGTRTSLLIGFIVAAINISIGIVFGAIEGYYGGSTDIIMQRFSEIMGRIPWLVTLSIFVTLIGPGIKTLIFILIINGWIGIAGVTRTQFYRFKGREYVLASRTLGANDRRLIFRHILPNGIGTIITTSILSIPGVIFAEATISYLGFGIGHGQFFNFFGVKFSGVSIGVLLSDGRNVLVDRPYLTLFPSLIISILMITFNMFGNALRDAFNPALRGSE